MFNEIKQMWGDVRGTVLKRELDNTIDTSGPMTDYVEDRTLATISNSLVFVIEETGPLENVSAGGQRALAKELKRKARECFDFDVGQSYGFAMVSMFLESRALSGADAEYVYCFTRELVLEAFDRFPPPKALTKEIDKLITTTLEAPSTEDDELPDNEQAQPIEILCPTCGQKNYAYRPESNKCIPKCKHCGEPLFKFLKEASDRS